MMIKGKYKVNEQVERKEMTKDEIIEAVAKLRPETVKKLNELNYEIEHFVWFWLRLDLEDLAISALLATIDIDDVRMDLEEEKSWTAELQRMIYGCRDKIERIVKSVREIETGLEEADDCLINGDDR